MTDERWLPIDGELGYEVSDHGRVRSYAKPGRGIGLYEKPKILKPSSDGPSVKKYLKVALRRGNHRKVHHLVLEAFVGPRPPNTECRHLDGNPKNNKLDNLCWGNKDDQTADKIRNGTMIPGKRFETIDFFDPFIPLESLIPFEVWKEIPRYPGFDVSNFGRVQSRWVTGPHARIIENPRIIKPTPPHDETHRYPTVSIRTGYDQHKPFSIHRLVMMTFNPKPYDGLVCRHLDGDVLNNRLSNLRWGTYAENMRDRIRHGTIRNGERCHFTKLSDDQVIEIRNRLDNREKPKVIAEQFSVSRGAISSIKTGRTHRIPTILLGDNND